MKFLIFTQILNSMSLPIAQSELIVNADGSIFHLHLLPEHIAKNIIVVGDQGRVETVSKHFDNIEHKISNREFTTHTLSLHDALPIYNKRAEPSWMRPA